MQNKKNEPRQLPIYSRQLADGKKVNRKQEQGKMKPEQLDGSRVQHQLKVRLFEKWRMNKLSCSCANEACVLFAIFSVANQHIDLSTFSPPHIIKNNVAFTAGRVTPAKE
jgi:hypothetical protein